MKTEWCVQFWDWDAWNVYANTVRQHKQEAIDLANNMNRETDHFTRVSVFGGHRFRVRRYRG
jgi:hypothetical protein